MPVTKQIVGIKPYGFVDEKTRERVEGYTFYLQWLDPDIAGIGCENFSMTLKKLDGYDPALNDYVVVSYNKYGKVDWMMQVEPSKAAPASAPAKQGGQ